MNADKLTRTVEVFKQFIKSGKLKSNAIFRITVQSAMDGLHTQTVQLATDLDDEVSRILNAVLSKQAHDDQVPPTSILTKNTVYAIIFKSNQDITLLIRSQPFLSFTSMMLVTPSCCSVFSTDLGLGARLPCNIEGNRHILPRNEHIHRAPPARDSYCGSTIDHETCHTVHLNVTSRNDFPLRTYGNGSSTRGGIESLQSIKNSLHLHCRTNLKLRFSITRLGNELGLVRKDFFNLIHSDFPQNAFFASPDSVRFGSNVFLTYFTITCLVLLICCGVAIVIMSRVIFGFKKKVDEEVAEANQIRNALVRSNLIELTRVCGDEEGSG